MVQEEARAPKPNNRCPVAGQRNCGCGCDQTAHKQISGDQELQSRTGRPAPPAFARDSMPDQSLRMEMSKLISRVPLLDHAWDAPSAFTPEALLDAVRVERNLPRDPVPQVCVLEFDGDLTDWLVATERAKRWRSWACFHTSMETVEVDGACFGLIARTIGGPYAVLVAEQLATSGARVILGLTSAGRVSPDLRIPSLVVPAKALRDEGTSHHYLPPADTVEGDAGLAAALQGELSGLGLPVVTGTVWTTDAPYRETAEQMKRHASNGILAVEMQAASLFAFGAARTVRCGVVAHVTNSVDHCSADQFDKGTHELGFEILRAMFRAAARCLPKSSRGPAR